MGKRFPLHLGENYGSILNLISLLAVILFLACVRWALELKGIPYQSVAVNLLQSEQVSSPYLNKSPSDWIPCLEINGEFLSESIAIIEWLDETYPQNPLLPQSPTDRAKIRELVGIIASNTQPVQNLRVMRRHSNDQGERVAWAKWAIEKGLTAYEAMISQTAGVFPLVLRLQLLIFA